MIMMMDDGTGPRYENRRKGAILNCRRVLGYGVIMALTGLMIEHKNHFTELSRYDTEHYASRDSVGDRQQQTRTCIVI